VKKVAGRTKRGTNEIIGRATGGNLKAVDDQRQRNRSSRKEKEAKKA